MGQIGAPFQRIVESANVGVWVLDPRGLTTFANAKTSEILGYSSEEMATLSLFDVLDEQGRTQAVQNLERRRQGASAQLECAYIRKDGSRAWILLSASPLYDDDGLYIGAVTILSEISDRKFTEVALEQLAKTDPLTKLRNRLSLSDELDDVHARSRRHGGSYALAMCDIDRFKAYNDTYGHQAGDDVIAAVGVTLADAARLGDGVYRYGGEEFLLVLPEQSMTTARAWAERARSAVERLAIEHVGGPAGVVTISVGVAALQTDDTSAEALLKEADAALYQAKADGRNRVALAPTRTPLGAAVTSVRP